MRKLLSPVLGTDPFYLSTPRTMRIAFNLACRRSRACADAAPGRSMERIAALAERLRRAPVVGRTREPGGPPATWTVDAGPRRPAHRAPIHRGTPSGSPDPSGRPPLVPPTLPVLVLSGGLDTLTTWTDGEVVVEQMGPSARWVKVENTAHVTALADPFGCASGLVRRLVARPERLHAMDVWCAARIPEVRAVGEFPRRLAAADPASSARGNAAGRTGLRLAAVGAAAVGDAIARWWYLPGSSGAGLRGGRFTVRGDPVVHLRLRGVRFVADAIVDGTATWDLDSGKVTARVRVQGPGGAAATLRMAWNDKRRHPSATVTGRAGGKRLAATLPAP